MSSARSNSGFDASSPSDSQSGGSASPILETLVVFALVAIAQFLTGIVGLMGGLFVLAPPISTNPWTIVTSVYAHGSIGHIVSNSIALVIFGWPIARATTRFRFHTFFVVTGAIAGIAQVWVMGLFGTATPVLGASGAVFALLGYLIAGNRVSESIASRVAVPGWVTLLFFLALAAVVTIATAAPRVALVAHFIGFLLGLVAGRARVLHP
ncbi:rhomboid family intramembrane serine protease [Halobacteria archaeon AArc-m2/3/4]|uniref:Rhomboid family intramembrane serine protease n=1 Tax=Natronoglomus mannanivorans TaxID=2979990 RepID=A0AAP2Z481_9EURY|nr:rhomboid family intramembrane serine protease [Halobacteria archaeon AArc-xg1-1]MCU4974653.1 rhomboid family intramembrane serine protease [Halobacteria archaeon AArc-m2/3/4]